MQSLPWPARDNEIHALQATVVSLANKIKGLETSSPSASSAPNPRNEPKIPDPPVFNGERKSLLPFRQMSPQICWSTFVLPHRIEQSNLCQLSPRSASVFLVFASQ